MTSAAPVKSRRRWLLRQRSGQGSLPILIGMFALLLFVMLTAMFAAVRVRAHRTAVLAAEAENTASFTRAATFAEIAVNVSSVLDWDNPDGWETTPGSSHQITPWRNQNNQPCEFDTSYSCWQARLGPITTQKARGELEHQERILSVRVIADCKSPDSSYVSPDSEDTDERLFEACETLQTSETTYRQRSFLQYGLHFSSQALPPGQQRFLNNESGTGTDPYSLITEPLAEAFGNQNVHTNEIRPQVCLVDGEPDWLSSVVAAGRVSSPSSDPFEDRCGTPDSTPTPVEASELLVAAAIKDRDVTDPPACLTDPSKPLPNPTRAALPYEPRWERTDIGAEWMATPFMPPYGTKPNVARFGVDWVSPPDWMLPAFLTAGGHPNRYSPDSPVAPNPIVVNFADLQHGDVIASLWDVRVHGVADPDVSATVVSAGTVVIDTDVAGTSVTVGGDTGDGVIALIAGCDIIIDTADHHFSIQDDPTDIDSYVPYDDSKLAHRKQVPSALNDIMPWYCQAAVHSTHRWCTVQVQSIKTGGGVHAGDGVHGDGVTGTLAAPSECKALLGTHEVTLKNVALLAPHGGVFARAAQCPHNPDNSAAPTLTVEGSIASGFFGSVGFQNPDTATRDQGYVLKLEEPDGPLEMSRRVPAWWPDTLGGEWQALG